LLCFRQAPNLIYCFYRSRRTTKPWVSFGLRYLLLFLVAEWTDGRTDIFFFLTVQLVSVSRVEPFLPKTTCRRQQRERCALTIRDTVVADINNRGNKILYAIQTFVRLADVRGRKFDSGHRFAKIPDASLSGRTGGRWWRLPLQYLL
jgi:hypothetical protein